MEERDLGTYQVRVVLWGTDEQGNERGWIHEWDTAARYMHGRGSFYPLDASRIPPTWESEHELVSTITHMYRDGSYACDCNRRNFLERVTDQEETRPSPCGETIRIKTLEILDPAGKVVWGEDEFETENEVPTKGN